MLFDDKYKLLAVYVKTLCSHSKFRHALNADDVLHDTLIDHQHDDLDKLKARAVKTKNKQINQLKRGLLTAKAYKQQLAQNNATTKTRCLTDPDYHNRLKEQKNNWARKQREKKTESYHRELALKRARTARHNYIRNSERPIHCQRTISNRCYRKSINTFLHHTVCPCPDKFVCIDGLCHHRQILG